MHVVNGYNLRQTDDLVSYVIESDRFDSSKQMEDMPAPKLPEIPSGRDTVWSDRYITVINSKQSSYLLHNAAGSGDTSS